MSLRGDGRYRCDRCNVELINSGVDQCAIVTDLDPRADPPGTLVRVMHLCRVNSCVNKVLTAKALASFPGGSKP